MSVTRVTLSTERQDDGWHGVLSIDDEPYLQTPAFDTEAAALATCEQMKTALQEALPAMLAARGMKATVREVVDDG